MNKTTTKHASQPRTQAQRRTESRQAVLSSAIRLFGEKGYADTSLDDIAADCGLTIRPIYHYFGNKKALFAAVNEFMEQRILDDMGAGDASAATHWKGFLDLCEDPAFRQIVLVDSPNVLGRDRWTDSEVTQKTKKAIGKTEQKSPAQLFRVQLLNRVILAAYSEAALAVAEAKDTDMARKEAEQLMSKIFAR